MTPSGGEDACRVAPESPVENRHVADRGVRADERPINHTRPGGGLSSPEVDADVDTRDLDEFRVVVHRANPVIDPYEFTLLVIGAVALVAGLLPKVLERRPMSLPIVLVLAGVAVFSLPGPLAAPDPRTHLELTERITEIGVLVSLVGVGLSIDRPIGLRSWSSTWRLLGIAMPVGIGLTAFLGWWWLAMPPATALLLGAVLAPTDPVLAADVQVGEPTVGSDIDDASRAEDEVRATLTAEAGLNDGLAFPFVYAALAIAAGSSGREWFAVDVVARVGIGVVVGMSVGWLVSRLAFERHAGLPALADAAEGFVAIALLFIAYGATELAHGYGFLAVFVAALTLRAAERGHRYHQVLHAFTAQLERVIVVVLLVLFGGSLVGGIFDGISWAAVSVAAVAIIVIRPVTARLALVGSNVLRAERRAIAFFGIRGIGSVYYLAYALGRFDFPHADTLWATIAATIVGSIAVHGVTATPALDYLDRRRERRRRPVRTLIDVTGSGR